MYSLPGNRLFATGLLLSVLIPYQVFANEGRLIFALDLIRHGDRTPVASIPNAPHKWAEGEGQLTALGMHQEFELGAQLHTKYIQETALLPPEYIAGILSAYSTDYDRTLMSAQSLFTGLYPPGSGPLLPNSALPALPSASQPVPIHAWPILQDKNFLSPQDKKERELLTRYVFSRVDWKEKSAEQEPNFSRWSQLTGVSIHTIFQLIVLGDTLRIYKNHHIPLPEGMTDYDAEQIMETGAWVFTTIFKPWEIGDAMEGKLLAFIKKYLVEATCKNARTKFVLLSAHDSTILGILSAMHVPLDIPPPYASDLNFSLYETARENYIVRVSYNGQPIRIPGCDELDCSLSQFSGFETNALPVNPY